MLANTSNRYGQIARSFHWIIAALIVVQYLLVQAVERAEEQGSAVAQIAHLANHKSLGMTVLVLAVARLLCRWMMTSPEHHDLPRWQARAASATHLGFYLLLFAIPVSGWLMSSAAAYSVSWFNVFSFPDLVSPSESLKHQMYELHEWLTRLLLLLIAVHVLAALKHHWVDHDDILQRMFSWPWLLAAVVVIGLSTALWLRPASSQSGASNDQPNATAETVSLLAGEPDGAEAARLAVDRSELNAWSINYGGSHLGFSGEQAGAAFKGQFERWQAQIKFSTDALERSGFVVSIALGSVNTRDSERDSTVLDTPFFNVARFPEAEFIAYGVSRNSANSELPYQVDGYLTLKGRTLPLRFEFAVNEQQLIGRARIDRLAFNVGEGEWVDTTWIGQYVDVNVRVDRQ